ncbi:hypothetical protein ACWEKJ_31070 [Amycolatopsis thermoflava]
MPAARGQVLGQPRQVEAVVDGARRVGEPAGEAEAADPVVVRPVSELGRGPVVHAERPLAFQQRVVVRDRVEQRTGRQLVEGPVGVQRDRNVGGTQGQAEVQPGDARPDDADRGHCAVLTLLSSREFYF